MRFASLGIVLWLGLPSTQAQHSPTSDGLSSSNPFTTYCTARGLSPVACGQNVFGEGGNSPKTFAAGQAALKCSAKFDRKSTEVQAILHYWNGDPTDMMRYASGSIGDSGREDLKNKWYLDPVTNTYYHRVPTPKDREDAAKDVRQNGGWIAIGLEAAVHIGTALVTSKANGDWRVVLGSEVARLALPYLEKALGAMTEKDAQEAFLNPKDLTGTAREGDKFGFDADGKSFSITPEWPSSSAKPGEDDDTTFFPHIHTDGGSASTPEDPHSDGNPPEKDSSTGNNGNGDNSPSNDHTGSSSPGSSNTNEGSNPDDGSGQPSEENSRPSLDPNERTALQKCLEEEEHSIMNKIGTMDIAAWHDIPKTSAEISEEADRKLKSGMCDQEFYGKDFCRKWKLDRSTEPLPPDLELDRITQNILGINGCAPSRNVLEPTICQIAEQEILKRYVLDPLGENVVKKGLKPWSPKEDVPFVISGEGSIVGGDELDVILKDQIALHGLPPPRRPQSNTDKPLFKVPKLVPEDQGPRPKPPPLPPKVLPPIVPIIPGQGDQGIFKGPRTPVIVDPRKPPAKPAVPVLPKDLLDKLQDAIKKGGFDELPPPADWDETSQGSWKDIGKKGSGSGTGSGSGGSERDEGKSVDQIRFERFMKSREKIAQGPPPGWTMKQWKEMMDKLSGIMMESGGETGTDGSVGHDEL